MLIPLPLVFTSDNIDLYHGSISPFDQTATIPTVFVSPLLVSHFSLPILQPILLKSTLERVNPHTSSHTDGSNTSSYLTPVQIYPEPQLDTEEILFSSHLYNFTKLPHSPLPNNAQFQSHPSQLIDPNCTDPMDNKVLYQFFTLSPDSHSLDQQQYQHLASYHQSLVRKGNLPYIHASTLQLAPCYGTMWENTEESRVVYSDPSTYQLQQIKELLLIKYAHVPMFLPTATGIRNVINNNQTTDKIKLILFLTLSNRVLTFEVMDALFMLDDGHHAMKSMPGSPFVLYNRAQNLTTITIASQPLQNSVARQPSIHGETKGSSHSIPITPASQGLLIATEETTPLPLYTSMQSLVVSSLVQTPITSDNRSDSQAVSPSGAAKVTKFTLVGPQATGKSTTLYNALSTLARFQQGNLAMSQIVKEGESFCNQLTNNSNRRHLTHPTAPWTSIPLYINLTTLDLFALISSTSTKFDSSGDSVINSSGGSESNTSMSAKSQQPSLINSLFSTWLNSIITIINNSYLHSSQSSTHEIAVQVENGLDMIDDNDHPINNTQPKMVPSTLKQSHHSSPITKKSLFIHFTDLDYFLRDEDHIPYSAAASSPGASSDGDEGFVGGRENQGGEAVRGVLQQLGEFLTSLSYLFSPFNLFIIIESNRPDVLPDISMPFIQIGRGNGGIHASDATQHQQQQHQIQQYTVPVGIPTRTEANLVLLSLYNKIYYSANQHHSFDLSSFPSPAQTSRSELIPDVSVTPNPVTNTGPSTQELWLSQLLALQKSSNVPIDKFILLLRKYKHFLPSWLNTLLLPTNSPAVLDFLFNSFFLDSHSNHQQLNSTSNLSSGPDWGQAIFSTLHRIIQSRPGLITTVSNLSSNSTTTSFNQLTALIQTSLMTMALQELRLDPETAINSPHTLLQSPSLVAQIPRFIGNKPLVDKFNGIVQQWQTLLNLGSEFAGAMHGIGGNIMLHGPHGNGKSLLIEILIAQQQQQQQQQQYQQPIGEQSKAVDQTAPNQGSASQSLSSNSPKTKLNIVYLNPSDIFSKWLGESEKKIRQTFALARQASPSLIIIDHIDSIASNRQNKDDGHNAGVDLRILSTLLNELDGLDGEATVGSGGSLSRTQKPLVFVIATCGDLDNIDPALLRSGRFDHVINVPKPNREAIAEMVYGELKQVLHQGEMRSMYGNSAENEKITRSHTSDIGPELASPPSVIEPIIDEMAQLRLSSGSVLQLVREVVRGVVYADME